MIARQSIGRAHGGVKGRLTEKVLMVVGATGAGKTTLINGMVNFILGVDWKDPFRYKLVVENKVYRRPTVRQKISPRTHFIL